MVRDGLVFKDEDGQVIFNQYSFCELVKHLLVELVGISYAEASQTVERSPLAAPVADALGVAVFSHDLPYQIWFDRSRYNYIDYEIGHGNVEVGFSCIIKQGDDYLYTFRIEPTTGGSFFRMLTEDLRLDTGLLDTFLPLIKAHYLDFIDCFEADPSEALQTICAPFTQPEDYSWCIHVDEQMVERYGTVEQLAEYRRQTELRGTPEHKAKNGMGSMLFHLSHANDVDQAWASSRTREELDQVVEPFVQAKRQTGRWTQEDEAGYQLYQQETDPKKRTFRVWYLIANPRGLPKEFVQKELEFRWKLFPEKKEESK